MHGNGASINYATVHAIKIHDKAKEKSSGPGHFSICCDLETDQDQDQEQGLKLNA